jgi:hypothetical protein
MLQMRLNASDLRRYSTDRDVAHNFPSVARLVADRLTEGNFPDFLDGYLRVTGTTNGDLCSAMAAYTRFFTVCMDPDVTDVRMALDQAGWFDVPLPAQLAVCAALGQVMTGVYWQGIRDASTLGSGPPIVVRELVMAGELLLRPRPFWRRFWDLFRS